MGGLLGQDGRAISACGRYAALVAEIDDSKIVTLFNRIIHSSRKYSAKRPKTLELPELVQV